MRQTYVIMKENVIHFMSLEEKFCLVIHVENVSKQFNIEIILILVHSLLLRYSN